MRPRLPQRLCLLILRHFIKTFHSDNVLPTIAFATDHIYLMLALSAIIVTKYVLYQESQ